MSLIVYSEDFSEFYDITHAISVQMSAYYNDIGKLVLTMPLNEYNAAALKNDRVLYDTQKKLAFVIKQVKIETKTNRITANGFTTNWLLTSRIVASSETITNIEEGVYNVVKNNLRGLSNVVLADAKGLPDGTETTLYGDTVLDSIMPVLALTELGHKMLWDHKNKQHIFEIYKGADLTTGIHAVVFSDEWGTARDLVINDDASIFKNVAYVKATYKKDDIEKDLVEIVGDATGDDRYEDFFDISLSAEDDETEAQFVTRMRTHGAMELGKLVRRLSFNVLIDPAEFEMLYGLGDVVSCVSNRFGVKFNARVSGIKFVTDTKGEKTEIILGEPKLTAIGGIMLNGKH